MSATTFQRQRRAVAAKYVGDLLATADYKSKVEEVLTEYGLTPGDLGNLASNANVLAIADALAADKLGEPELDSLETIGTIEVGDRAAVHSPDIRADQIEPKLQHPCAETVAVGNMHDGPQAAEDLANVAKVVVDEHDGSLADAAADKADALADHGGLPEVVPTSAPVKDAQVTAEDTKTATDPEGKNPGADTKVDVAQAAEDLAAQEAAAGKLEKLGKQALLGMGKTALSDYAEARRMTLELKARTTIPQIVDQILAQQGGE